MSESVPNIRQCHHLHHRSHENEELTAGGRTLAEVKNQRSIFQENSLLLLLAMMSLNYILKKSTEGYKFTKSQNKINHLMYMDDMKLFAKKGNRIGSSDTNNKNKDTEMKFGIKNVPCS